MNYASQAEDYKKVIDILHSRKYDAEKIVVSLAKEFPSLFLQINSGVVEEKSFIIRPFMQDIFNNCRKGNRIEAIKLIRANYDLGLKEAKDICDWLMYDHASSFGNPFPSLPGSYRENLDSRTFSELDRVFKMMSNQG